jgi:hypothetical protein
MSMTNHYMQEDIVWKAFRRGNERAFDSIYDTHFSKLYNYGVSYLPG